jgi:hypothetical protein
MADESTGSIESELPPLIRQKGIDLFSCGGIRVLSDKFYSLNFASARLGHWLPVQLLTT